MTTIKQFIASLDDVTKIQIREDRDRFEKEGSIGDCVLREKTKEYMRMLGVEKVMHPVTFMELIAQECDRYFADKYVAEIKAAEQRKKGKIKLGAYIKYNSKYLRWPECGVEISNPDMIFDVRWAGKYWICKSDILGSVFVFGKDNIEIVDENSKVKMKGKIKRGAAISHDFRVWYWPECASSAEEYEGEEYKYEAKNPDMVFDVEWTGRYWECKADLYGSDVPGRYGNGSIFVFGKDNVEIVDREG